MENEFVFKVVEEESDYKLNIIIKIKYPQVGNEFVRGVSGGERKRVNIGMELILDPPVLFLDEPTTGLDANTANQIVLLLYKFVTS